MRLSLPPEELGAYVARQFAHVFPDGDDPSPVDLRSAVAAALERTERCFSGVRRKYFHSDAGPTFNHRNTDQYAVFLYYLANSAYRRWGDVAAAEKAYALNKTLHGLDAFYQVELPEVFLLVHPLGTVLGRGRYADYLCVYQGCTVGANLDDVYPDIGEGVALYGGSRVIGASRIGPNSWISAGAAVIDADVPGDCVVFGGRPALGIKPTRRNVKRDLFGADDAVR